MDISISPGKDATTITLAGEIDLHASPTLRAELQSCIHEKTPVLLLDFTNVDYIDSSGLAALIEYARESAPFKGKVAIFGLKAKVRAIFDLVRLNQIFTIADSSSSAIAALRGEKHP